MSAGLLDARPVRRVEHRPSQEVDEQGWPFTLAPVRQLLRDGLDLPAGVTFLVGENGSGKSTLVEGIAMAYGFAPEGGSTGSMHTSRASESPLHRVLRLVRGVGSPRWGYFLRAETMHGLYTYLEQHGGGPAFHELSHGEGFLELAGSRMDSRGFFVLDEPESALSFTSCLALVGQLAEHAAAGSQVLCATHSPLLTALPGATILQLDEDGLTPVAWEDLAIVDHWRRYLHDPRAYLRHVLPEGT